MIINVASTSKIFINSNINFNNILSNSASGAQEISTVDFAGSVDSVLAGSYILMDSAAGAVYFWFYWFPSEPIDPNPGGRGVRVDLADEGNTAQNIAERFRLAVDADVAFSATRSGSIVTITDATNGARTDISAGTSGLAVAVIQQGS